MIWGNAVIWGNASSGGGDLGKRRRVGEHRGRLHERRYTDLRRQRRLVRVNPDAVIWGNLADVVHLSPARSENLFTPVF